MSCSRHNISAFIVFIFILSAPQTALLKNNTNGNCSPIVDGVAGNVPIECRLSESKVPIYKFSGDIDFDTTRSLAKFISTHTDDIIEFELSLDLTLNSNSPVYIGKEGYLFDITESKSNSGKEKIDIYYNPKSDENIEYLTMKYSIITSNNAISDGQYLINGFYYIEEVPGMHQGIMQMMLKEIPKGEVIMRGYDKK